MKDRQIEKQELYSQAIKRIHIAFTHFFNDPEKQIEELFRVGIDLFNMDNASYVEVVREKIIVRFIYSTMANGLAEVQMKELPYYGSMAEDAWDSDDILVFEDLTLEHIPEKYKVFLKQNIRSFIHIPVWIFGEKRGIISWSSSKKLNSPLLQEHLQDLVYLISNSFEKVLELKISGEIQNQYREELQKQMEQYIVSEQLNKMGVWYRDAKTNRLTTSKGAVKAIGIPALGDSVSLDEALKFVHPDDALLLESERKESYETGQPYECEFRLTNGEKEVWMLIKGEPVYDEQGELIAVRGTIQNIDEDRKLRQERNQYKALLEEFVRSNPVPVAMFDTEMRYIMVSERWLADYALDISIIGKKHYDVVPGIKEDWKQRHQEALNGKSQNKENDFIQWPDGSFSYISWAVGPWYYPNKEIGGIILYAEDVTNLKEKELKIAAMADQLTRYSQKLEKSNEDLENFASLIGHDLQEPLRKIKAFGDMLKRNLMGKMEGHDLELLERMVNSSERMQDLVNKLLEESKKSTKDNRKNTSVRSVILDVLDDLEIAVKEADAEVEIDLNSSVYATRQELYRLFQNIISNSIKYREDSRKLKIKISDEIVSEETHILIKDNGIGVDKSNNNLLFEFFTRGKEVSGIKGYGIGLAACRDIMVDLNGEIEIFPAENGGTMVKLAFKNDPLKY
ncbi:ATP-binding protein [Marinigracilibium pacificum]|uniref:histidine kinase n=1 Tax=Marinigracilibium pacificum TaxID=2729599 RepID=A0A848J517_9BACT|nr:ATP-binding protein [Marinigracilibium pacificum]NMM50358.1 PAS domain-containing protein [Marinigracilibium pacificum]